MRLVKIIGAVGAHGREDGEERRDLPASDPTLMVAHMRRHVVHLVVDDNPAVVLVAVLSDLLERVDRPRPPRHTAVCSCGTFSALSLARLAAALLLARRAGRKFRWGQTGVSPLAVVEARSLHECPLAGPRVVVARAVTTQRWAAATFGSKGPRTATGFLERPAPCAVGALS
eukprot:scaffold49781_cov63-Phaeocystis_antarctica.AAC.2